MDGRTCSLLSSICLCFGVAILLRRQRSRSALLLTTITNTIHVTVPVTITIAVRSSFLGSSWGLGWAWRRAWCEGPADQSCTNWLLLSVPFGAALYKPI